MFTMTLLLIYYLNFKLGNSQDVGSQAPHEVRDRDYFFLWSFSAWGVWAALGLVYVWESIAALIGSRDARTAVTEPTMRSWLAASPTLLLAAVPLVSNWSVASRNQHHATRDVAADMLNSVEPYGVLVTVGDNDTFPLWYAQEVEGIRRDVVVANTSLLNTDWYARQIIRRPVYPYDAAKGPAIYRDKQWIKPTTAPLHMTFADADGVPEYYQLQQPMEFNTRDIHATIDPRKLEYGVLQRADALVLRMIQDAWPERPIYFARSAVGYPRTLGLENYVITQGLASKLFVPPANRRADERHVAHSGRRMARRGAHTDIVERRLHRTSIGDQGRAVGGPPIREHAGVVHLHGRGVGRRVTRNRAAGGGEQSVRDDETGCGGDESRWLDSRARRADHSAAARPATPGA